MRDRVASSFVPAALILFCIAAYFLLFVPPTLDDAGPQSIWTSYDFHSYFLPKFRFGTEELLAGRLPVWNQYEYAGLPFLATAQPAALYPPKVLLFALLPEQAAYWTFLVLHYVLSAWGFLLFMREQRLRGVAAFVGTAAWVFALPTLTANYHPIRIANLSWMPFCFLLTTRIVRGAGLRDWAWLVLVVALQLTAGYPEYSLDIALLLPFHATLFWLLERSAASNVIRPPWRAVPLVAGAFLMAAVIAGAQLIPLVEIALEAKRSHVAGGIAAAINYGSDGAASLGPLQGHRMRFVMMSSAFLGFLCLGMIQRAALPALAGMAICLWLAMGGWLVLRRLPGFSLVRFPFLWLFISVFFPAWLSAVGCDAFVKLAAASTWRRRILAAIVSAGVAVWGIYCGMRVRELGPAAPLLMAAALLGVLGSVAIVVSAALLTGRRSIQPLLFAATLLVALAHVSGYPFGAPSAAVERPGRTGEVAQLVGAGTRIQGRVLSVHDICYGYNLTDRIPSAFGAEESFVPWRYRKLGERMQFQPFLRSVNMTAVAQASGFLAALNVEYVATSNGDGAPLLNAGFRHVMTNGNSVLYRNERRMGAAWVNYGAKVLREDNEAQNYLLSASFDPHHDVILEKNPVGRYAATTAHPATPIRAERRPSPTELEIDVDLPRAGILVVSESAYPGWRVWVDGQRGEWLRANYVLRGVELPPGSHRVRFEYQSAALRWGVALSCVGLLALVGIFIVAWRKPRKASV